MKKRKFISFGTKVAITLILVMVAVLVITYFGINYILTTSIKNDYKKLLDMSVDGIEWDIQRMRDNLKYELERFISTSKPPKMLVYIIKGSNVLYKGIDIPDEQILNGTNFQCMVYDKNIIKNTLIDDYIVGYLIDETFLRELSKNLKGSGFVAISVCNRVILPYYLKDVKNPIEKNMPKNFGEYEIDISGEKFIMRVIPFKDFSVYVVLSTNLFYELKSKLSFVLLLTLICAISVVIFVSLRFGTYLKKSFRTILDGFEKLREGEFEFVDIKSNDELALMMAEFNVTVAVLKEAVEKLKIAKEIAEEANKTKSMFLASVSHEIRTPLNSILGFTEMLLKEESDPKKLEYLKTIYQSGEHLLNVINDILDLSKIEAGKMELSYEYYNPVEMVKDIVKMYTPIAMKKGINLTYKVDEDVPEKAIGDPFRIKQILINLVSNALKFTNEGYVIVHLKSEDGNLIYIVEDTGIGIPQEKLEKIFEPFVQADVTVSRKYGGTGLGLTISKKLANMMNGDLWIESEFGKGTKVYLKLPVKVVEETKIIQTKGKSTEIETAVVCVNNTKLSDMVEKELLSLNFKVRYVENLEELNGYLKDHDPRLIVVEVNKTSDVKAELRKRKTIAFIPADEINISLKNVKFLPLTASSEEFKNAVSELLNISLKESLNIALVEDNEVNRKVITAMIRNFLKINEILEFVNGKEVVDAMEDTKERDKYDLVLMDAQMPLMDGFEATKKLRELGYKGRIIMVSASVTTEDIKKALEAGCDEFVAKPVKSEELKSKIMKFFPAAVKSEKKEQAVEVDSERDLNEKEEIEKLQEEPTYKEDSENVEIEGVFDTKDSGDEVKNAVEMIMKEMEMDEDMAIGMVRDYINFLKRKLKAFEKAINDKDTTLARKVGHDLSGSGKMYGFPEITKLGDTIRSYAKEGNFSALEKLCGLLKEKLEKYEKGLSFIETDRSHLN